MDGYTTNDMFKSQGASLENDIQQGPEQQVPEQQVPEQQVPEQQVLEQQVPEQQVPEHYVQEQEHPENNNLYNHHTNDETVKEESCFMSLWNKLCNYDNITLLVLAILIAVLYKLYI